MTKLKEQTKELERLKTEKSDLMEMVAAKSVEIAELKAACKHANAERNELKDELKDWVYQHQRVLDDARPSDEVHCSCCGDLRLEVERLKAELEEWGDIIKRYMNKLKGKK